MAYQKYIKILAQTKGSLSDKVNTLMMCHADEWGWEGSDSIIADMLDNGLDLQSTIAILEAALSHECQTEAFQAAVQAIQDYQLDSVAVSSKSRSAGEMPLSAVLAAQAVVL